MSEVDVKPPRSWREIAWLTAQEQNPQRVRELAQELIRALDAENNRRMPGYGKSIQTANEKGAA
jgi:hypothetical protein